MRGHRVVPLIHKNSARDGGTTDGGTRDARLRSETQSRSALERDVVELRRAR